MKSLVKALPALALAGLLGACSSTPPLQFYTLGPLAPPPASAAPASTGPSLVVGPVSVPATIDRLLIVRLAGSRADVAEHHRWAAPLKTEIARRIAADLARRSSYTRSVAWPQASIAEPTLSVPVDVLRFEADGFERVTLEAVWTVRQAGRDLASRRFNASEAITAPTFEALASAHGRLVDALATEIAGALP
ncbi:MAG: membrane integrity-associated transporter subunit PqiC [Zoogloea sp.]|nr:membrane integrity-associated transporter subunit PqiC [Zoogloea sp.]